MDQPYVTDKAAAAPIKAPTLPGQVVLVLQGGGALGAYQCGVYEALHETGIEPNWVIGTSIGAINAAIMPVTQSISGLSASASSGSAWSAGRFGERRRFPPSGV
jgi:predicted acylesterase/phospholipase RssA